MTNGGREEKRSGTSAQAEAAAGSRRLGTIRQLVKFNLVGVLNTAVDFVVYALLLRLGVYLLIAQCVSYSAGMVNSYLLNKFWTFGDHRPVHLRQALRFIALNAVSLGLSVLLLYVFHSYAGLHPMLSKAFVTVFTMVVNFLGTKRWVFRERADRQTA